MLWKTGWAVVIGQKVDLVASSVRGPSGAKKQVCLNRREMDQGCRKYRFGAVNACVCRDITPKRSENHVISMQMLTKISVFLKYFGFGVFENAAQCDAMPFNAL